MLHDSPLAQARRVRLARDIVDSTLLISAILLAWRLGYSPLEHAWLAAKIIALLGYIVIGSVALKHGKTRRIRLLAWLVAQLMFLYIVSVAMMHDPQPWNAL